MRFPGKRKAYHNWLHAIIYLWIIISLSNPRALGQSSLPVLEPAVSSYLSGDYEKCLSQLLSYSRSNKQLKANVRHSILSRIAYIAAWKVNNDFADLILVDIDSLENTGIIPDSTAKADRFFLEAIKKYNSSELTEASDLLIQSAQYRSKYSDFERAILADTYGFQGWIYKSLEDYSKAVLYYTKAIQIDRELNRSFVMASEITELAGVRIKINPFDKEIESGLKEALAIYTDLENYPFQAFVNNEYGILYQKRGNLPEALLYFLKTARIKEANNEVADLHKSYNNIGALYENMNQSDSSIIYIRKAISLVPEDDRLSLGQYYYNLGTGYGRLELPDSALHYFDLAIEQLTPPSIEPGDSSLYFIINSQMPSCLAGKATELYNFYKINQDIDYLKKSIQTYDIALHQLDELRFLSSFENKPHAVKENRQFYFLALQYAAEYYEKTKNQSDLENAFILASRSKGLVFDEYLRMNEARDFLNINPDLLKRDDSLKIAKTAVLKRSYEIHPDEKDSIAKYDSIMFEIDNALTILGREIEEKNPSYYQGIRTAPEYSSKIIRENLDEDELLLDFTWHKNQLIIMALGSTDFELHTIDVPQDLREMIGKYSKYLQGWSDLFSDEEFKITAWEIYNMLLKPLEPLLLDRSLYIIPDDSLAMLPFETLLFKEPETANPGFSDLPYLIKKNPISYFHSIQQFVINENRTFSSPGVIAFAPFDKENYNDGINELGKLAGSGAEIQAIKKHLPSRLFKSGQASEKNFRNSLSKPRIIHVATHGLIADSTSLQNHLLFNPGNKNVDNKFHLFELFSMQVESPLVVLSSCNTGAGTFQPGEGVLSLARAFHFAGTPSLIMSQWPVDDEAAVIIMDEFYAGIKSGLSLCKSLQQAKCLYIDNSGKIKSNPNFWASFQLTGYSDEIVIQETANNLRLIFLGLGILILLIIILTVRWYMKNKA